MLSGVASALFMARRIHEGLAANNRPSITNRIPKPMRKSANAMDLIGLKPPAGCFLARLFQRGEIRAASKHLLLHRGERVLTQNRVRPLQSAIRRPRLQGLGAAALAAGWAGACPDELLKNLKKSESGRSRNLVSLLFNPFSYAVIER